MVRPDNVTNGQRSRGALETTTDLVTLLFDLGSGNEQAVQSVSFTTEGFTDFARDPGYKETAFLKLMEESKTSLFLVVIMELTSPLSDSSTIVQKDRMHCIS